MSTAVLERRRSFPVRARFSIASFSREACFLPGHAEIGEYQRPRSDTPQPRRRNRPAATPRMSADDNAAPPRKPQLARIVEAPPATGETVDISFTNPLLPLRHEHQSTRCAHGSSLEKEGRTPNRPAICAGAATDRHGSCLRMCGCDARSHTCPALGSLPSPMRKRMQPRCEHARKAGTWQLIAAYLLRTQPKTASAELPHRCSPAVFMLC